MQPTSIDFNTVDSKLESLGWDWNNPRITSYINELSVNYRKKFSASNLPQKHYRKLYQFLSFYEEIDKSLSSSYGRWDDPIIANFFTANSERDIRGKVTYRMKLKYWYQLKNIVDLNYIPF
ncbi:hypothetical protein Riv7116_2101 [Rivularia sp. PCC 7116]|nr:hypothetical protein Riv7116_2101 [Rivularia sp. PCC 7116]